MTQPADNSPSASIPTAPPPRRRVRLVTLIVTATVIPLLVLAGALLWITLSTASHVAETLGHEIVTSSAQRAARELSQRLDGAVRVSNLYAARLAAGDLRARNWHGWQRDMLHDLQTSPDIASICMGTIDGDAVWLMRGPDGLIYGESDGRSGNAYDATFSPQGQILRPYLREYRYDPRTRPWYGVATAEGKPTWTPIYFWFGENGTDGDTGIGFARPIRDDAGEISGVLVIDVTLGEISQFLASLPLAKAGLIIAVDEQGYLVGASEGKIFSDAGARLRLSESTLPGAADLARLLSDNTAAGAVQSVTLDNEPARATVSWLTQSQRPNWRVIAVVPESAFMTEVQRMRTNAVLLGLLVVATAVAVGVLLSVRLSRPLSQLAEHAAKVGGGDFDARIHLDQAHELQIVSSAINDMAAGLRRRVELEQGLRIAETVQKSLLPSAGPKVRGMTIAGQSRYADDAGGDYFDFIEVAGLGEGKAMVAVGDVMGHGIGSALLMASARSAIRASVSAERSLGSLLAGVNDVLARDAHGMFMTLVVLIVDGETRAIRWASAGHDPVVVYDPHADRFFDLDGADVPLGVSVGSVYEDFTCENLPAGAILIAGTDGIWEARNPAGEMFGKQRLMDLIRDNALLPVDALSARLERAVRDHVATGHYQDDVTFVLLKLDD
jgi:sigma-B regulation protein RsbU (phosphoserine phosphatase)